MRTFVSITARLRGWMLICLLLIYGPAYAASSILVWPIDPVIEADQNASALWLENRGAQPITVQIRVLSWQQENGENQYSAQTQVAGTPPMAKIEPGQKQLVRLTRMAEVAANTEQAYRILVDEIPMAEQDQDGEPATRTAAGIRFQMRYSIPLFVYGAGLSARPAAPDRPVRTPARPILSGRIVHEAGKTYLEIRNTGQVHARLTQAHFQQGERRFSINDGLLGYVLPGSQVRWPLSDSTGIGYPLMATINGSDTAELIPIVSP